MVLASGRPQFEVQKESIDEHQRSCFNASASLEVDVRDRSGHLMEVDSGGIG